jgi:tellurite resistance protein TerC
MHSIGTPEFWTVFIVIVLVLLSIDLGLFHRHAHAVGLKEATFWSAVWVLLSLSFGAWIYSRFGKQHGLEFYTGYLIEYALSVDNVFVFIIIFSYFGVPPKLHHRVLFWGILGALMMRAAFIVVGAVLIAAFHWVIYLFGAFLGYESEQLFTRHLGKLVATPLALVLVTVEASDVVFALDSIPAIFGVTRDPFIVYTSNVCAILGLRSMYFLLAAVIPRFAYLGTGLGIVLMFIGIKMLIGGLYAIPTGVSLAIVAAILAVAVILSLLFPPPRP